MNSFLETLYLETLVDSTFIKSNVYSNLNLSSTLYSLNANLKFCSCNSDIYINNLNYNFLYPADKSITILSSLNVNDLTVPNISFITNLTCNTLICTTLSTPVLNSTNIYAPFITSNTILTETISTTSNLIISSPNINLNSSTIFNNGTELNIASAEAKLTNKLITLNNDITSNPIASGIYIYNGSYLRLSNNASQFELSTPNSQTKYVLTTDLNNNVYVSGNSNILASSVTVNSQINTFNVYSSYIVSNTLVFNNSNINTINSTIYNLTANTLLANISSVSMLTSSTLSSNNLVIDNINTSFKQINTGNISSTSCVNCNIQTLNSSNVFYSNNLQAGGIFTTNLTILTNAYCSNITTNSIAVESLVLMPYLLNLNSNAEAAANNIPIGGLYRTADIIRVRL